MTVDDQIRAAQAALAAARVALQDAEDRLLSDAPDTQAALDDATRRYVRALELARAVHESRDTEAHARNV